MDNVEHIFATNLPPGRYDLRVIRRPGVPTALPNYAVAFDFASTRVAVTRAATNVVISWPVNEAGLLLEAAAELSPAVDWQADTNQPFITNGFNTVTLPGDGSARFFRLHRP